MIDIQNQADDREIDIDQVGVSGLRSPIVVLDRHSERQSTVASLSMSVALPQEAFPLPAPQGHGSRWSAFLHLSCLVTQ